MAENDANDGDPALAVPQKASKTRIGKTGSRFLDSVTLTFIARKEEVGGYADVAAFNLRSFRQCLLMTFEADS